MKLTSQHIHNISALIHFMDGLSDPQFSMRVWAHDCNTPACALGWATRVPELTSIVPTIKQLMDCSKAVLTVEMADRAFGENAVSALFRSSLQDTIKTPKQWADFAREYLHSHGCEVTARTVEQAQDFKRFMEVALRPVPVEASA